MPIRSVKDRGSVEQGRAELLQLCVASKETVSQISSPTGGASTSVSHRNGPTGDPPQVPGVFHHRHEGPTVALCHRSPGTIRAQPRQLDQLTVWLEDDPRRVAIEGLFDIEREPPDLDILPIAISGRLTATRELGEDDPSGGEHEQRRNDEHHPVPRRQAVPPRCDSLHCLYMRPWAIMNEQGTIWRRAAIGSVLAAPAPRAGC